MCLGIYTYVYNNNEKGGYEFERASRDMWDGLEGRNDEIILEFQKIKKNIRKARKH